MKNFLARLALVSLLAVVMGSVALALAIEGKHEHVANVLAFLTVAVSVLSLKETR